MDKPKIKRKRYRMPHELRKFKRRCDYAYKKALNECMSAALHIDSGDEASGESSSAETCAAIKQCDCASHVIQPMNETVVCPPPPPPPPSPSCLPLYDYENGDFLSEEDYSFGYSSECVSDIESTMSMEDQFFGLFTEQEREDVDMSLLFEELPKAMEDVDFSFEKLKELGKHFFFSNFGSCSRKSAEDVLKLIGLLSKQPDFPKTLVTLLGTRKKDYTYYKLPKGEMFHTPVETVLKRYLDLGLEFKNNNIEFGIGIDGVKLFKHTSNFNFNLQFQLNFN